MNDEINKKLRIKQHWEKQIMALGGPNYMTKIPSAAELDGKALPGRRGYKCAAAPLGPRAGGKRLLCRALRRFFGSRDRAQVLWGRQDAARRARAV